MLLNSGNSMAYGSGARGSSSPFDDSPEHYGLTILILRGFSESLRGDIARYRCQNNGLRLELTLPTSFTSSIPVTSVMGWVAA